MKYLSPLYEREELEVEDVITTSPLNQGPTMNAGTSSSGTKVEGESDGNDWVDWLDSVVVG